MKQSNNSNPVYSHDTLEFVTVGVEFCAFLEKSEGRSREEFLDKMLKLLPLLYMKIQLLPEMEREGDFLPPGRVTEEDYNYIRSIAHYILGENDEYLDVSYDQRIVTDETIWKQASEHLADIYQAIRNFLAVYQDGIEDCMADALWYLKENFEYEWGFALVDAIKRLHWLKYFDKSEFEEQYD